MADHWDCTDDIETLPLTRSRGRCRHFLMGWEGNTELIHPGSGEEIEAGRQGDPVCGLMLRGGEGVLDTHGITEPHPAGQALFTCPK